MGTTSDKLTYLNTTKGKIKDVINMTGANITSDTTFRNYATKLYDGYVNVLKDKNTLLDNMPKGTSTGAITDAADLPVYEDKMSKESTQETRILPDGYTQVDYIESSGTQYIDTNFVPNVNSTIILKGGQLNSSGAFLGYRESEAGLRFYLASIQNKIGFLYPNSRLVSDLDTGSTSNIIEILPTKFKINNTEVGTYSISNYSNLSIYLSCLNTNNGATAFSSSRIYYFKVFNNNDLIRSYIPCYRNSDNEVGLYDIVNNLFYTNQGTGSFTYGSIVSIPNPDYPQDVKTVKGNVGITITDGTNTRNYTIPLGNNEICGIGTYKDELIVDKNGKCWLNKKTGKVVLDGSEGYTVASSTTTRIAFETSANDIISYTNANDNPDLISNRYISVSYDGTWKIGNISRWINRYSLVFIMNPNMRITQFKEWLSTHNTEVYYPLATSQLIDLNYTVDLTLFEGVNNISNSDDMDMEIKYIKDTYE